jgi:glycerol kinase
MSGFILAVDQGTTDTKASAIDGQGRIASRHSMPTPVR